MVHADMVRTALTRVLRMRDISLTMVQGDTSSALGGALAAQDVGCLLAHVEAGLRTHDLRQPWPEEENRTRIDALADLMFAPTQGNAANLFHEKVQGVVHVTGNPGIDALAEVVGPLPIKRRRRWFRKRRMDLLVTCHRRENWGEGLDNLARALIQLGGDPGIAIDVVLHPNPVVAETMWLLMGNVPTIRLIPPQSYQTMIGRMRRADLILSDSGGMQEEASALGVPLLLLRDKTERSEALASGSMEMVGTEQAAVVAAVRRIRADTELYDRMARACMPFGDGHSAPRIAALTLAFLEELSFDRENGLPLRA